MPQHFRTLFHEAEDSIIRTWAEALYAERRTDTPARLSYEQLVNHLPDLLTELAALLDAPHAAQSDVVAAARRVRAQAQVRFYQGVLIDEVARELMLLREVVNDFLWREHLSANRGAGDARDLREALRRADWFVDEMLAQAIVIYAASLRPPVQTRTSVWPPPRRRRTDFSPQQEER